MKQKDSFLKGFITCFIITLIIWSLYTYLNTTPIHIRWGSKFNIFLILFILLSGAFAYFSEGVTQKKTIYSVLIASGLLVVSNIIFFCITTPLFHSSDYRDLIGNVEEKKFEKDVSHVDLKELPTIDKELARNYADKKLGEIPALGSQMEVGDLTIQQIRGKLYYVAPLEHTGIFKWFENSKGTKGFIKVSATDSQDVELVTSVKGKDVNLKYLPSSYFNSNLYRHVYLNHPTKGVKGYTFELDDEGNPYWVASVYKRTIGRSGEVITGTLVIDPQTGKMKEYSIKDTPKWVDIIQPKSTIADYLDYWGEYVHGYINFSNQDKLETTEGMQVIYNNGECYFYTGISSVGKDESTVGFVLANTRTGKTSFYKVSGATETASMQSAEGSVQQLRYTATFPILINVQNEPTYFLTLKDKKGLVKSYAMVNVENYNIVAIGDSLQATLNNYVKSLAGKSSHTNLNSNGLERSEVGTIERIGSLTNENGQVFYILLKEKPNTLLMVPSSISKELPLSKEGDKVKFSYIELPNMSGITAKEFGNENMDIK
ncbi:MULTISPECIES: cell shape-determining protein [Bacillus cereus group]|uniref:cell shape-determining protein n=1 Tax=Bacillus cereus group TaxID=86661 RepID=UPI0020D28A71|nr:MULTISPECIES: cell shape-determining protein [Bacillus cereus group]